MDSCVTGYRGPAGGGRRRDALLAVPAPAPPRDSDPPENFIGGTKNPVALKLNFLGDHEISSMENPDGK
jgi:hypothetical protein